MTKKREPFIIDSMNDTDSDSADLPKTEAWKCLRKRATSRQSLVAGEHHSDAFTVIMHHNMLSTILVLLALAAVATAFMPNAGRLCKNVHWIERFRFAR